MNEASMTRNDLLLWLGRYTERVHTSIRVFIQYADRIIGHDESCIGEFCESLGIPNEYTSCEDFVLRFCFDKYDEHSIACSLNRAYENAVALREDIGPNCVGYVQHALDELNRARGNYSPIASLQRVLDNMLAFWAVADDMILQENMRNIIKVGKRIERVSLYCHLHVPLTDLQREAFRLADRIRKTDLKYNRGKITHMLSLAMVEEPSWPSLHKTVETLVE